VTNTPFPSKAEVLAFIRESPSPVGKREIARAFRLRGDQRVELKALLKELKQDGLLEPHEKRKVARPGALPAVAVLEVSTVDPDGELLARPVVWNRDEAPPTIYLAPERRGRPALGPGERVLARLTRLPDGTYEGQPIRVLGGAPKRLLGLYDPDSDGGRLHPTDRRAKTDFRLAPADAGEAEAGDLVLVEVKPHHKRLALRDVRVVERLGPMDSPKALSLISIHEHGLPTVFTSEALAEAAAAGPVKLGKRRDLRRIPLVTIDGADARDFDDAVWAETDTDPANPGGWHLLVAIADVAHYVRPRSALDRAAQERGNSAYFPDRVVPMLPEALSNGWCSLRPGEERPVLAAHLWLDRDGRLLRHGFERGLMRSAARLTYSQVQAAHDGDPDEVAGPLLDPVIRPLYGAYRALARARTARGTLDLDLPERQIVIGGDGTVEAIEPRARLDSHRLIEEFMITANVAAAETLEERRQPCLYRVHDAPDPQKIEALRQVLETFGLRLARGQVIRPRFFAQILDKVADEAHAPLVSDLVLRAQSQAAYAPGNLGHFGLALSRYAHFTSPIRRYADLMVHRALISGLALGAGGLEPEDGARFEEIGQHISTTERRAQAAEREAVDRFTAAFLKDSLGTIVQGRITGVTRFGLFVQMSETGADGLVPISTLPQDFYDHRAEEHRLVGRRWGRSYRLGDRVQARLVEANPLTGGLVLELVTESDSRDSSPSAGPEDKPGGWDPLRAAQEAGAPGRTARNKSSPKKPGPRGRRRRSR
jgi:ribonuclease R